MKNINDVNAMPGRPANEHRRASRWILSAILALLFVLAVWCICVLVGSFLKVKAISVEGMSVYTDKEIIAVSGIEIGDKKKSIDAYEAETQMLARLPYIADISVKKKIGGEIIIYVTAEHPSYIVNIANDYYVMSSSFKVLGITGDRLIDQRLVLLELPNVKRALIGSAAEFYEDVDYITGMIELLKQTSLWQDVTAVDASDKYRLSFECTDKMLIDLGEYKDIRDKLLKIEELLDDEKITQYSEFTVDVSDLGNVTVKPRG